MIAFPRLSRRAILLGAAAATGCRTSARARAGGASLHYFPPASRLGILKPDELEPHTGDPRNLLSLDHSFQVEFRELTLMGEPEDSQAWERPYPGFQLVATDRPSAGEERRLFVRLSRGGGTDDSQRRLKIRTPGWIGQLDVKAVPTGLIFRQPAERWRPLADAVIASALVRPAVGIADFLREHGMALDLTGLHARHFGTRLVMSLEPPASRVEATRGGHCYLAMEVPPMPFPFRWSGELTPAERDDTVERAFASIARGEESGPWRRWRRNGIDWFASSHYALRGTGLFHQRMIGYGRRRAVTFVSYCRGGGAAISAALERLAASLVLIDER